MNQYTDSQISEFKGRIVRKEISKTKLAAQNRISVYKLNKLLGCGYKHTNGKRGRKKGFKFPEGERPSGWKWSSKNPIKNEFKPLVVQPLRKTIIFKRLKPRDKDSDVI